MKNQVLGYDIRHENQWTITRTHQIHVLVPRGVNSRTWFARLVQNGISLNLEKGIFGLRHFLRIGVQEVIRMGMNIRDMGRVADLLDRALRGVRIRREVRNFARAHRKIAYADAL